MMCSNAASVSSPGGGRGLFGSRACVESPWFADATRQEVVFFGTAPLKRPRVRAKVVQTSV